MGVTMINLSQNQGFSSKSYALSASPPPPSPCSCFDFWDLDFFQYRPILKINSEHTFIFPEIPLKTFCVILQSLNQPTLLLSCRYVGSSCSVTAPFLFVAAPPNLLSASHCPPIFFFNYLFSFFRFLISSLCLLHSSNLFVISFFSFFIIFFFFLLVLSLAFAPPPPPQHPLPQLEQTARFL